MSFMPSVPTRILFLAISVTPVLFAVSQQGGEAQVPMAEQVFKKIEVFKGVPASDLLPAMQFMAASMKMECTGCHDAKDFSADTRAKETSRKMVLMQRDINAKFFNNRLEVTCNSCHNGQEHPAAAPIPNGIAMRHPRLDSPPMPGELIAKHNANVGTASVAIVRTGSLTAPSDVTHKVETQPLEFIQSTGGKYRMVSGERKAGSDGQVTWYGPNPMVDEPAAVFNRMGRAWRGEDGFAGLVGMSVAGKDLIGKTEVIVVRASRPATKSTEELYFDKKSGFLLRMVNFRRSTIGTVISSTDYANYKNVGGAKVPMKITTTFAGGEQWIMDFKSAKSDTAVSDAAFKVGG